MSFRVQVTESPSVVWKTALPRVNRSCTSPAFRLNKSQVYWTISGRFIPTYRTGNSNGYEEWKFELKSESTAPNIGVICYIENKNNVLVRCFLGEIGNGKEFKLTSSQLQAIGITDDVISMISVFECRSKCLDDILKDPVTPKIEAANSKQHSQRELPWVLSLQNMAGDVEQLLDNQEHSDAILKCGCRIFSVNRNILSARSEVFAAMFRNKMSENQSGIVEIADMESSVLEEFLRFVYSGRLDATSMNTVCELYRAGDKYAVSWLKWMCKLFMMDNLSEDNACQVLRLADMFNDTTLLNCVITFVAGRGTFLKSAAWNDFVIKCPSIAVKVYQKVTTVLLPGIT